MPEDIFIFLLFIFVFLLALIASARVAGTKLSLGHGVADSGGQAGFSEVGSDCEKIAKLFVGELFSSGSFRFR